MVIHPLRGIILTKGIFCTKIVATRLKDLVHSLYNLLLIRVVPVVLQNSRGEDQIETSLLESVSQPTSIACVKTLTFADQTHLCECFLRNPEHTGTLVEGVVLKPIEKIDPIAGTAAQVEHLRHPLC